MKSVAGRAPVVHGMSLAALIALLVCGSAGAAVEGDIAPEWELEDFEGMDATAFWHDLKFSFRHLNDFSRCAVVSEKHWVSVWTEIVGPFIRCDVEHFEPGEIEAARAWLSWPEGAADV